MVKNAKNGVNPASAFRVLTHLSERVVLVAHQISHLIFKILLFVIRVLLTSVVRILVN